MEKEVKKKRKRRKKKTTAGYILKYVVVAIVFLTAMIGIELFSMYTGFLRNAPELDTSKMQYYSSASIVYDNNGDKLAEYPGTENVDWVKYDEIPQQLIDAFVEIEDKRYFEHHGVDWKRTMSAVIGQLTKTSNHGGSTITQQLIKNVFLTSARTYERKAQEIHLALKLEKELSKEQILEWYLNIIFLGENNYGIKNAAKDYFGKELSELTLRECAMLAGLPQSPSTYDPRTNYYGGDRSITDNRTNDVLWTMHEDGKISDAKYEQALNETVTIRQFPDRFELYEYPTYVEYAIEDAAKLLMEVNGEEITSESLSEKVKSMRDGGYHIYTAFDQNIQDITQESIANYNGYPTSKSEKQAEASAVIIDQRNGRVVAMVGGREESTVADGYNRATDSIQAVGSSMKPLSVYAPALDVGYYPGTTVRDIPEKIEGYDTEKGYPGGETSNSMITMRRALELSHNIPAVRFILNYVHMDRSYDYLVANGFDGERLSMTPAGMALGADGVTTLEMTAAYATLANGGVYNRPHAAVRIEDRYGNVLVDESMMERRRVFKESTAWLITDMMETNMTNGLGVNARLNGMHSAGKTGTHEKKVVSFGGYTPYYTSFVRISTDDYADFVNASSYTQTTRLWKDYMSKIHEGLADREIQNKTAEELGIKKYWVCNNSGQLAQDWCDGHWEYAAAESAPVIPCEGHSYGETKPAEEQVPVEQLIDFSDPDWYLKGWWDEQGGFHPY